MPPAAAALSKTMEMPAASAQQPRKRWSRSALPSWKTVWFQLHWFIGITAGTVLMVTGLTGAIISFQDELLEVFNPGVITVEVRQAPVLAPAQIAAAMAKVHGERRIGSITLKAEPGNSARVTFAPPKGERRGETVYVDPYTGAQLGAVAGADFFIFINDLHRRLVMPRETGSKVVGTVTLLMLGLALSGLYLRWPRRPLDWRTWLMFNPALRGRSFLWNLHSVLGTWVLPIYILFALTGIYWSFDVVRDQYIAWADPERAARDRTERAERPAVPKADEAKPKRERAPAAPVDLTLAWSVFQAKAGPWSQATITIPEQAKKPVQYQWVSADARHDRQRNRMSVQALTGEIGNDSRYDDLKPGQQLLGVIRPLHTGSFFGMPGRIAMMLAALSMPVFGVTGWMLYLNRRRERRATEAQRKLLGGGADVLASGADPMLVAYASQSGQAERLALQTAGALHSAGLAAVVQSLDKLDPEQLKDYRRALFVVSSFGEGEPPDSARRFTRQLQESGADLASLEYGMLALGDRAYDQFCGYGHALDHDLRKLGGRALEPLTEVDNQDAAALARWSQLLATITGGAAQEISAHAGQQPFGQWRLSGRQLLNPGSQGGPLFEITLQHDEIQHWLPGALAEILPRHPQASIDHWLRNAGLSGATKVTLGGQTCTLAEALADSMLPPADQCYASEQACAEQLHTLAPRRYSLASIPQDGQIQLLVRQERYDGGLGLASGWLTEYAPLGSSVALRLEANPGFGPAADLAGGESAPCIYIGNGSGLSGLRAHMRARVLAGQRHNWLLYGEREREHDHLCADEIEGWKRDGFLSRLDLVFSRAPAGREYVQDRLRMEAYDVKEWIEQGAVIYVCGSLVGMAGGVDAALTEILGQDKMDQLSAAGRYRRDVY